MLHTKNTDVYTHTNIGSINYQILQEHIHNNNLKISVILVSKEAGL